MAFVGSPYGNLHAHPRPDTRDDRQWIAAMDINVRLCNKVNSTPAEVYCPEVRRSPYNSTHHISHLDVVSSWKGLSPAQAGEIVMWERLHRSALEAQISYTVRRALAREILLPLDKKSLSRLEEALSSSQPHYVDIDVHRLVDDMLSLTYQDGFPKSTWFAAQRNLPAMVLNFIRTRDCYIEAYPHTFVEVNISYSLRPDVEILCEIVWQPPLVQFLDMPLSLSSGDEYRISPVYVSTSFGLSGFEMFSEQVEFLVASDSLPVKWDARTRCFRAIVPSTESNHGDSPSSPKAPDLHDPSAKPALRRALLTANITLEFPDNVRFVRTTRYNIKLEVTRPTPPVEVNKGVDDFDKDAVTAMHDCLRWDTGKADIDSEGAHDLKDGLGLRDEDLKDPCISFRFPAPSTTPSLDRKGGAPTRKTFPCSVGSNSGPHLTSYGVALKEMSSKRKASKQVSFSTKFDVPYAFESTRLALDRFEHADLELTTKRQRVGQRRDSGVLVTKLDHYGDNKPFADDESWYDGEVDSLGKFTTMSSGEAQSEYMPSVWTEEEEENRLSTLTNQQYYSRTKSRAYEAGLAGPKVMPSLKKKGSIKRVVFQRTKAFAEVKERVPCPTPADSDSDFDYAQVPNFFTSRNASDSHLKTHRKSRMISHEFLGCDCTGRNTPVRASDRRMAQKPVDGSPLNQGDIKKNFEEFVMEKAEAKEKRLSVDEEEAYEKIFLQIDSSAEGEDWDTEAVDEFDRMSDMLLESSIREGSDEDYDE